MSRITNHIAEMVAKELTETKKQEIKDLENYINEKAFNIHFQTIPVPVMQVFKKHPHYFDTTKTMQLTGPGLSYQFVNFQNSIPSINHYLELTELDAIDFVKLFDEKTAKEQKLKRLKNEIKIALINLRTYKNIETNFPEAFKCLPKLSTSTALAVNFSDLRAQLA